jgi:hypothetical protein
MNPLQQYRSGLSGQELVHTLQGLLAAERTAMRLTCRYLADFADCVESGASGALAGYSDVYHAAQCLFGLGAHSTRERVRVGRALRALPQIEQALVSGELTYSRAREVTRVAHPDDESAWLALARTLPMRTLEKRVVEAAGHRPPSRTADPAIVRWTSPAAVEIRWMLPADTWALLERAMEGARRASESSLCDAEALAAVARDALSQQNAGADTTDPRHTVVLYECQGCGLTELDTGAGAVELEGGAAEALGCGARLCDLRTEGRFVRRGGPLPRAIERAVRLRDRNTCRVPGCHRRRYVDVHHIALRSEDGEHSRNNCLCLCTTHHGLLHDGRLRIEGDAEGEPMFYDEAGAPIGLPSHGGTSAVAAASPSVASHGGTSAVAGTGHQAATLLALMGRRGGWSVDALVDASGLGVDEVHLALLELELDGRAHCDPLGRYAQRAHRA